MQTAKRILKKASAEDEDPLGGLLNCRNSPFDFSCLPQPVDRDRVLKTLHQRRRSVKSS